LTISSFRHMSASEAEPISRYFLEKKNFAVFSTKKDRLAPP
jgi:hypothetical protein